MLTMFFFEYAWFVFVSFVGVCWDPFCCFSFLHGPSSTPHVEKAKTWVLQLLAPRRGMNLSMMDGVTGNYKRSWTGNREWNIMLGFALGVLALLSTWHLELVSYVPLFWKVWIYFAYCSTGPFRQQLRQPYISLVTNLQRACADVCRRVL